jgi:hypothetical protein
MILSVEMIKYLEIALHKWFYPVAACNEDQRVDRRVARPPPRQAPQEPNLAHHWQRDHATHVSVNRSRVELESHRRRRAAARGGGGLAAHPPARLFVRAWSNNWLTLRRGRATYPAAADPNCRPRLLTSPARDSHVRRRRAGRSGQMQRVRSV